MAAAGASDSDQNAGRRRLPPTSLPKSTVKMGEDWEGPLVVWVVVVVSPLLLLPPEQVFVSQPHVAVILQGESGERRGGHVTTATPAQTISH